MELPQQFTVSHENACVCQPRAPGTSVTCWLTLCFLCDVALLLPRLRPQKKKNGRAHRTGIPQVLLDWRRLTLSALEVNCNGMWFSGDEIFYLLLVGAIAGRRVPGSGVCPSSSDPRLQATHLCVSWMDGQKINGFALLTKRLLATRMQETIKIPLTQLFTMKM